MTDSSQIQRLAEILKASENLCVFTGAGISCPSGIPDFRSADGLYNQNGGTISPEEIISHSFFLRHPKEFYQFYCEKMVYPEAKPNKAHRFFAELASPKRRVSIVTQNIDGLHTAAGSDPVFELHGSVHRNRCIRCGTFYDLDDFMKLQDEDGIPRCTRDGGAIKPEVVLYEEPLDETVIDNAIDVISHADTMVIVGTSLVVYPAASFVRYFRGKHLILINKSETDIDGRAELAIHDDAALVSEQVETILKAM